MNILARSDVKLLYFLVCKFQIMFAVNKPDVGVKSTTVNE